MGLSSVNGRERGVGSLNETGCKHLYSGTGQEGIHLLSYSKIVNQYQSLYMILICPSGICY